MKSLEEYLEAIRSVTETETKAIWLKADMILDAQGVFQGKGFTKTVASELGYSDRYVQILIKTARTFPPEDRLLNLSFSIHRTCASTKDPEAWLIRAHDEQLSERQIKEELKALKDTGTAEEKCEAVADRLCRSLIDFTDKHEEAPNLRDQLEKVRKCIDSIKRLKNWTD